MSVISTTPASHHSHGTTVPTVSVVTIFLNAERFLAEAIESVLSQEFQDWELLLIDDGSSDGSRGIAQHYAVRFADRIRCFDHRDHANLGMSASRNAGIARARGRYVAFLDADDIWLSFKLAEQVALLDAEPRAAMVSGASRYWHGWTGHAADLARDRTPDLGLPADRLYAPPDLAVRLYPLGDATPPPPSDWLLRRTLVSEVGGFEECFTGPHQLYEDQAFLAKVFLRATVALSSRTWTHYRIHPDSCSSAVARTGQYRAVRARFLQWLDDYVRTSPGVAPEVRRAVRRSLAVADSRWSFRVAGGNRARLRLSAGDADTIHVEIDALASPAPFDVQANFNDVSVRRGERYRLSFRARAERPRQARVGIAQAHEPWAGLGWYRVVDLTPEWTEVVDEFIAAADEPVARVHFDLADSPAAVDIAAVALRSMTDPSAPGRE